MLYKKSRLSGLSKELFKNPTAEYRGSPFWAWNCRLEREVLKEQIGFFKKMGFGGFHMHSRTGLDTAYMSKEYLDAVRFCVDEAKNAGLYAYLYDEDRWPSGAAGGLVTKDEQYRMRYLRFTETPFGKSRVRETLNGTVECEPGGTLLACYDICLGEDGNLQKYRRIAEQEPAEGVKFYACLEILAPSPWFNGQTYADTMNRKAIERFIEVTHEKYKEAVGKDFGEVIPSVFSDEPEFFYKEILGNPTEKKDILLPWTDDFANTYQSVYQEDLLDFLPEVFWELPNGNISVHRYRFHDHAAERFAEAFADTCGQWCEKNNLSFTGHMMAEPTLEGQTSTMSEAMRMYRGFQLPGIDMLCSRLEYTTAKQAQSVVHQDGREGMMSELYGACGWDYDFRSYKLHGDWQAALGVTLRVPHLSWMSMAGQSKRDFPGTISYQTPWFQEFGMVEDHFARLNTAMTRGKPVVKIGVIHPVESNWIHWGPESQTSLIRSQLEDNFQNLTQWLLFGGLDFDFISESLLPQQCEKGEVPFRVGQMEYDTILVPGCETLRTTTLERLRNFKDMGGRLIFMGEPPKYLDAAVSNEPKKLWEKSEHISYSRYAVLTALEKDRLVEFRSRSGGYTNDLLYQLRQDKDCRWLFIARGTEPKFTDCTAGQKVKISLKGSYEAEIYDTMTGKISPCSATYQNGKTCLEHTFYSQDSLLLRLTEGKTQNAEAELPEKFEGKVKIEQTVSITLEEPNVLLLDQAEYALDGEAYHPAEEILRIDEKFRAMLGYPSRTEQVPQPWTQPEEPFTHEVQFRFTVQSMVEAEAVFLALEDAERIRIRWNFHDIPSKTEGWFADRAIKKVSLGRLKKGSNILELSIPYCARANLEWCYLLGDFGVSLKGGAALVTEPVRKLGFGDITSQGLPFYSGNLVYHIPVQAKGKIRVHVPYFRAPLVGVVTDGEQTGRIAFAPYNTVVPAPSDGVLNLKLYGNRVNSFGPVHKMADNRNGCRPRDWRTSGDFWTDGYALKTVGILSAPVIEAQNGSFD